LRRIERAGMVKTSRFLTEFEHTTSDAERRRDYDAPMNPVHNPQRGRYQAVSMMRGTFAGDASSNRKVGGNMYARVATFEGAQARRAAQCLAGRSAANELGIANGFPEALKQRFSISQY
jgi:hypothetical protein